MKSFVFIATAFAALAVAHEGHDHEAVVTTTSVAAVTTSASHADHADHAEHSSSTTLTAATSAATVVVGGAKNTSASAPTGTPKPVVTVNAGGRLVPFWRWYM